VTESKPIDADSDGAALEASLVRARSAIHAAEGATPGWPSVDDGQIVIEEGFDARVRPAALVGR
jgi:hypothetical protein